MDGIRGIATEDKKELQRKESGSSVSERNVGGGEGEETKDSEKKVLKDGRNNREERPKMEN